jgi:hypothetical protein
LAAALAYLKAIPIARMSSSTKYERKICLKYTLGSIGRIMETPE